MSMSKKIKAILLDKDMTIKELSTILNFEGSYLYNKLARDKFTEKELKEIAKALNFTYEGIFTSIDDPNKKF